MSGTPLRRRGADYGSVRGNLPGDAGETLTWRVHSRDQPAVIVSGGGVDAGTVPTLAAGLVPPTAAVRHLITLTRLQAVLPTTPAEVTTAAGGAAITRPPIRRPDDGDLASSRAARPVTVHAVSELSCPHLWPRSRRAGNSGGGRNST
jgi:hypothetical protein